MTEPILKPFPAHLQNSDMAYDPKDNRLRRKDAVGMDRLIQEFIREMKIASGVNKCRAQEAWNHVSHDHRCARG